MMAWVAPLSIIMDGNSPYPCIPSVTRKSSLEFYVERDPEGVAKKKEKRQSPPTNARTGKRWLKWFLDKRVFGKDDLDLRCLAARNAWRLEMWKYGYT